MSKDSPEVSSIFSGIAHRYDLANRIISLGLDHGWRHELVRLARPQPGERVLDLCTGTADLVIDFLRSKPKLTVVGLDISLKMLQQGLRKTSGSGFYNLMLVNGNALKLPFASGSFEIASIAFGLRNLPQIRAGLREMARVLSPNGRLLILEFSVPKASLWRRGFLFYLRHILPCVGGWLTGSRPAYQYLHDSIVAFPEPAEILGFIERAGFHKAVCRSLMGGVVMLYCAERTNVFDHATDSFIVKEPNGRLGTHE